MGGRVVEVESFRAELSIHMLLMIKVFIDVFHLGYG
jgi:hypothetical protein